MPSPVAGCTAATAPQRTNRPKWPSDGGVCSHVKYRVPATEPSFLPAGSSSSMPSHTPPANRVRPANRTTPVPPFARRTRRPAYVAMARCTSACVGGYCDRRAGCVEPMPRVVFAGDALAGDAGDCFTFFALFLARRLPVDLRGRRAAPVSATTAGVALASAVAAAAMVSATAGVAGSAGCSDGGGLGLGVGASRTGVNDGRPIPCAGAGAMPTASTASAAASTACCCCSSCCCCCSCSACSTIWRDCSAINAVASLSAAGTADGRPPSVPSATSEGNARCSMTEARRGSGMPWAVAVATASSNVSPRACSPSSAPSVSPSLEPQELASSSLSSPSLVPAAVPAAASVVTTADVASESPAVVVPVASPASHDANSSMSTAPLQSASTTLNSRSRSLSVMWSCVTFASRRNALRNSSNSSSPLLSRS